MAKILAVLQKITIITLSVLILSSCGTARSGRFVYSGERIELDSVASGVRDTLVASIMNSYKPLVDEKMQEVVALSELEMGKGRPESLLSNFTTNSMCSYAERVMDIKADFALVNFGGLRAILPIGSVRRYDIYSIYPFENYLVIIDLPGRYVEQLFKGMAEYRVEALSRQVSLHIKNKRLESALIDGKEIDPDRVYKIVTLDFLFSGGDRLDALKSAISVVNSGVLIRDVMFDCIKYDMETKGSLSEKIDGRVRVEGD